MSCGPRSRQRLPAAGCRDAVRASHPEDWAVLCPAAALTPGHTRRPLPSITQLRGRSGTGGRSGCSRLAGAPPHHTGDPRGRGQGSASPHCKPGLFCFEIPLKYESPCERGAGTRLWAHRLPPRHVVLPWRAARVTAGQRPGAPGRGGTTPSRRTLPHLPAPGVTPLLPRG